MLWGPSSPCASVPRTLLVRGDSELRTAQAQGSAAPAPSATSWPVPLAGETAAGAGAAAPAHGRGSCSPQALRAFRPGACSRGDGLCTPGLASWPQGPCGVTLHRAQHLSRPGPRSRHPLPGLVQLPGQILLVLFNTVFKSGGAEQEEEERRRRRR